VNEKQPRLEIRCDILMGVWGGRSRNLGEDTGASCAGQDGEPRSLTGHVADQFNGVVFFNWIDSGRLVNRVIVPRKWRMRSRWDCFGGYTRFRLRMGAGEDRRCGGGGSGCGTTDLRAASVAFGLGFRWRGSVGGETVLGARNDADREILPLFFAQTARAGVEPLIRVCLELGPQGAGDVSVLRYPAIDQIRPGG